MTKQKSIEKRIFSGNRKTAVAKLRLTLGKGKVFYNHLDSENLGLFHKLALAEPIRIHNQEMGEEIKYDFHIKTQSGGKQAQIQAARLAIARAILEVTGSETLRKAYVAYDRNMIVPDSSRATPRQEQRGRSHLDKQSSIDVLRLNYPQDVNDSLAKYSQCKFDMFHITGGILQLIKIKHRIMPYVSKNLYRADFNKI